MKKETEDQLEESEEMAKRGIRDYAIYSTIVFQMLATIGLGFWGGKKLNDHYGIENNLLTVGIGFLGLALAMYNIVRQLNRIQNKKKK